ncbi:BnaC07g06720D [Brassica napus]|uniref:BnaC07g06720D protein n=4 Tax=Brassica TaxID=3705 RepID=A0A078G841_BRANA|nr:BnaC07g06720D [Brassica napus]
MAESFEELGLSEEVMGALKEMSIEAPTEIQCIGIPAVMDRKSVVLGSHTGSGKTLAYLLPIVQLMREDEATLESQVDEKAREVKGKDELVAEEEKLLKEKEDKIVSLQTEVSSLQGSSDSAKQLGKVQARVVELEKQVRLLSGGTGNFLEQKNKEKTSTEARTKEAEKKLTELNSSLDKVCIFPLVSLSILGTW